jgi:lipopolysaccharide transport system permease protein
MLSHLQSVWSFRHFWMALVRMDLRTKYKRSVLGLGWSVLNPIMMSAVLMFGFGKVLAPGRSLSEYGAYLLSGLCVWEFMRNSMSLGCHALTQNEAYIRQSPLPYAIYPLRTVAGTGIHFLITLVVTVVISCLLVGDIYPLRNAWMLPPSVVMLFLFCWSLAAIFSFANAYFHDTQHLTDVAMSLLFFLTPVMMMPDSRGARLQVIDQYNPFNVFMKLFRDPLFYDTVPPPELWLQATGITGICFATACCVLGALQKKVIFQL